MFPPISPEEKRRLDALERYYVLDTPPEPALDRITRLAARLFRAPMSLMTLLDQSRQSVKSSFGLDCREIPREHSFCAHTIQSGEVTVIPDALADDRFRQDPLVNSSQQVRFYAGAPLRTPDGFFLGTLCILDSVPSPPLSTEQRELLSDLAATAMDELELRRSAVLAARATLQNEGQLAALSESLRFSEKSLRSALDTLPVGVWIADARGQLLLSNRAGRELWGGAHYVNLERYGDFRAWWPVTGRRLDPGEWGMARALRGEVTRQEEIEIESFDVTRKVILNSAVPIWDQNGNVVGGVSVDEDITSRVRNEAALRASETQFRAVFDGAVDSMFILDDDWRYIDCNPAAIRLVGRPREEVIGRRFGSLSDPEHGEELLASVRASAMHAPHSSHTQLVTRDKRIVQIDYTVQANFLPGRHLLIARDVTEHMRLETQLRQAQKMEAVGRLAGGVAHDFNNLLTVILGYSQIALSQLTELDPLRASIVEVNRAGERAAALTRQLLAFSRKQVLKPEIVDLNAVIADTEKMLRRLIGEDIELITKLGPKLAKIKVDSGQIEQVIVNLAVNARDAMPDGGRILIETAEVDFESAVEGSRLDLPLGPYVILAVSDTGAGMDTGTLSHIFEPFFTTKGQGKGTGLGLSTVYGIVKQSGGDIWVYSEPGHGTTFKVYLPAISDGAVSPSPEPPAAVQHGTETVLVVEDEPGVRDLITQILKSSGYRVLAAANGGDALLTCERFSGPIDLLVTDIIMPGMSGRELAERLASLRPGLRVLYTSGYTDQWVFKENMHFIHKPFTPQSLTRKVREVFSTRPGGRP